MRFSLLTLLLATLFVGSLMLCWFQRDAWLLDREELLPNLDWMQGFFPTKFDSSKDYQRAPDGRRKAELREDHVRVGTNLLEVSSRIEIKDGTHSLYTFNSAGVFYFVDDDTALVVWRVKGLRPTSYRLTRWHRRYPEWWWGHFYRAEVWSALLFGVLLILSAVRDRRARRNVEEAA